MPQATEELRREWWPKSDPTGSSYAIQYLQGKGYVLTKKWTWIIPAGHTPTSRERRAAEFLIQEWDFDGMEGL